MTRPDYCPVAQEPCQAMCVFSDVRCKIRDTQPTAPVQPEQEPLTDEQRQDLMNKAWHKWLSKKDDGRLFAWDFSFVVEAAHGIKEKNHG